MFRSSLMSSRYLTYFAAALSITSLAASPARADAYAYANSEKSKVVLKWGSPGSVLRATLEVAKRGGDGWFQIVGSNIAGHGAIYCASRPTGMEPHYFVSEGLATLREALQLSRDAALNFAAARRGFNVYVCGTFKNPTLSAGRSPSREIDEGGERLLRTATAIIDAELAKDEKRLRIINAVDAAISADPKLTASTQAESIAKYLLDMIGLNTARKIEADADAAYRARRINETILKLESKQR